MKQNPINEILKTSIENIGEIVDVNKVVGDPIKLPNNIIAIPISKVVCGYGVGGSQFKNKTNKLVSEETANEIFPFGGASGGGLTITPSALIIIKENKIQLINVEKDNDLLPKILETVKDIIKKWLNILLFNFLILQYKKNEKNFQNNVDNMNKLLYYK